MWNYASVQFSSVQSLSRVWLFVTPRTAARQASLSITNSRSPPKPVSIESVMPSNHLILCRPLLLLPPVPPSIRVFSNESTIRMRRPKLHKLESRLPGEISITSDMQMTPPLWQKVKSLSRVWLFETPWTVAYHAPSLDFPQSTHTFSNVAPHKKICLIRCSWAYDGLTNWYLATLWISG